MYSFEEAFILYNYENDILNKVLKKVKRKTYNEIVGSENRKENLKENSYKLQRELTNSKSDFSNELLYKLIICDDIKDVPNLPEYIQDGLKWLQKTIKSTMDGKI